MCPGPPSPLVYEKYLPIIIIIINNQPIVKESCPGGNDTLSSRVELQPLTRVCLGLIDHIGFEFFKDLVCMPDM